MHNDTCVITCSTNSKAMTAEVLEFKEKQSLRVAIERSVSVTLNWNGKMYVGRCAGLEFETVGPVVRPRYQGRR